MSESTSENSNKKPRGRPAKVKTEVLAAVTDEDLAFDRELERIAREQEPQIDDATVDAPVKKEKVYRALLSDILPDTKIAQTVNELENQVHLAVSHEVDSVEASIPLVKSYVRSTWSEVEKVGYFMFKGIKVWIPGFFETKNKDQDETMEQKLFGQKK